VVGDELIEAEVGEVEGDPPKENELNLLSCEASCTSMNCPVAAALEAIVWTCVVGSKRESHHYQLRRRGRGRGP